MSLGHEEQYLTVFHLPIFAATPTPFASEGGQHRVSISNADMDKVFTVAGEKSLTVVASHQMPFYVINKR